MKKKRMKILIMKKKNNIKTYQLLEIDNKMKLLMINNLEVIIILILVLIEV